MRCVVVALALACGGCGGHRVVVTDQVSGQPVDRVTVTAGARTTQGDGTINVTLPPDDQARITVAADGYRPWITTVGAVRQQPTIPVILDPRWRRDFRTTKPTAVVERKPCPCKNRTVR